MIIPVIMAGGVGSRLWPLSRKEFPKQFLKIASEHSMIQETVLRLSGLDISPPLTICNEEHRFVVAEQLREINQLGTIILEPVGRNTAPAIALAALSELNKGHDPLMLVLAADHVIEDVAQFQKTIKDALHLAQNNKLVTFGIVPSYPETGYGYICKGDAIPNTKGYCVDRFVEKPDEMTAKEYLASGNYLWNSGMFIFKASRYIDALKVFSPEIVSSCQNALKETSEDLDFLRVVEHEFKKCPDDSIDYAVMEPLCKVKGANDVVVVPLDACWNDIGSFSAIWDISKKDPNGNVIKGDVISQSSTNNLIISEQKLVSTVGINNCIVIETKDAILVADKDSVQDVKKVVEKIKSLGRPEADIHRQVYRPWGYYDSIDCGSRDHVKRITVNPGHKLSIQMHHHRAEHWIVVSGTAKVTNGDNTFLLTENQSTYIPAGVIHALENPGIMPLEVIEVRSGSYLGEDDIVRFDDRYGRT